MISTLINEYKELFEFLFIRHIPGRIGGLLRKRYWRKRFGKSGSFSLSPGCVITRPDKIIVGDEVHVMHNCYLYAHNNGSIKIGNQVGLNSNVQINAADSGEITIGNDVAIGPNTVLRASNHSYKEKDRRINVQGHTPGRIVIEEDVWIGANCVILAGAFIHRGAVIAAGAVVNRDIPEYALAGGVPAKVIKLYARE